MGINREYKLPDYIPVRGHLMLHNKKISKSRDWYISLKDFVSRYNPDFLRFYIANISPSNQDDVNFDWDIFYNKINNELIDNIGNFINRTLSFIKKTFNGIVPIPGNFDEDDKDAIKQIMNIPMDSGEFLLNIETDRALKNILKFSSFFNQYFQKKQPWINKETSSTTLYISINAVQTLAIVLAPFIPNSAEKIWLQLNDRSINLWEQSWNHSSLLTIQPGHKIGHNFPIFKKIEKMDIEKEKIKLRNNN
jgi:methionyl-tRNA synthetase